MYACGLSYKVTQEYVFLMFERGLLDYKPMEATYSPSEKGLQYLAIYEQMKILSDMIDLIKKENY